MSRKYQHGKIINTPIYNGSGITTNLVIRAVISASSDGTVRRWEVSSGRCDRTLSPARAIGSFADISVMLAEPLPQDPERLFVVPRFHEAFVEGMDEMLSLIHI